MLVCKKQFEVINDGLLVRAPAKINLSLLIAGRRPDGFHEIETIMAKVDFFDEILIQQNTKPGIELICKGAYPAPEGEENLVYKACEMLLDSCGSQADIKITLTKNIPAGAGLGSASTDAAAALIGVNQFLRLDIGKDKLAELAAALGSDTAFFLDGPLALCTGRGEKIKKLDENFDFLALLLLPDVNVPTKKVYANYEHNSALYTKLKTQINDFLEKNRIDLVSGMCTNMLETSCFSLYEGLAVLKAKTESLGIPLCLSGSGSAMFYIMDSREQERAEEYKRKLEERLGCKSIIVRNNRW
ncbi:MAG: 4-(cytidine 5'-diphospho)-2-C-methyl-D-erythritol kinase [Planctomycetota bacterium]|jgi:4-diphosphocytidyl-2-C-methyl-D-erythritol kinase